MNALTAIENRVFDSERISRRAFGRHAASATAALLVARRAGTPVGYALVFFRRGSRSARLYSLAVLPQAHGGGLGEALLRAAEEVARARDCARMRLEVRDSNEGARRLYGRCGFRPIGRRGDYYADGEAALCLEKRIGEPAAR